MSKTKWGVVLALIGIGVSAAAPLVPGGWRPVLWVIAVLTLAGAALLVVGWVAQWHFWSAAKEAACRAARVLRGPGGGGDLAALAEYMASLEVTARSGKQVPYFGPRTPVLAITIPELRRKIHDVVSARREAHMAPFLGKWLPLEGEIQDISGSEDSWRVSLATGAHTVCFS
jgi:hypothetical protein